MLPSSLLTHVPRHQIYTFFFQSFQGGFHHFPGQPVSGLNNPLWEASFLNIQPKPSLTQLKAISFSHVAWYWGKQTNTHLATSSFWGVVERVKVFPEPPFLQGEQLEFAQLLLIDPVL